MNGREGAIGIGKGGVRSRRSGWRGSRRRSGSRSRREERRILEVDKGKILVIIFVVVVIVGLVGRIVEFVGGGMKNLGVEGVGRGRGRRGRRDGHGECVETKRRND